MPYILDCMESRQIWLKPKPTHIDENFEDFLDYLRSAETTSDTLYVESLRLLKKRVDQLIGERVSTPIYRQVKDPECLKFNIRLCGAWLLAVKDTSKQARKQVLLTMTNNLIQLALHNPKTAIGQYTLSYKCLPDLIRIALALATYDMPQHLPFGWNDLRTFSLDIFVMRFVTLESTTQVTSYYEGRGLLTVKDERLILSNHPKPIYLWKRSQNSLDEVDLLPEYGFVTSSDKDLELKESQRDDVEAVEEFAEELITRMQMCKKGTTDSSLRTYAKGDYVPVEVTEVTNERIKVRTIDPNYQPVEGVIIFEETLKIFSKVLYPVAIWAKVLRVGDRFNLIITPENKSFSLTELFVEYIRDNISFGKVYDAHNYKGENSWLMLREFWTEDGFMIFVDITKEDDLLLEESDGYAGIQVIEAGSGNQKGCMYGRLFDYEAEHSAISREVVAPKMLRDFIYEHSEIKISAEIERAETLTTDFVREFCTTINLLQSREDNPMLRYRLLVVLRLLCTLTESETDSTYYSYLSRYIKTLIRFAKADSHEGDTITDIKAPEDLMGEEGVTNGTDILRILSCFAKDYDTTSEILDPYIEEGNGLLSKVASLVQAYNRLYGLLESKTLRGIKKQILSHLSVVIDGDSTLELTNELEGIFGEEDDMKEFKTSFFVAPKNALERRQSYNIFRGICAMMNNRGGVLYLGVNDKGVPVGLNSDLKILSQTHNLPATLDAYIIYISKMGEECFGETYWKYVTIRPMSEYNVVSIAIEPYPYDVVRLKDGAAYLRKNNASAPITEEATLNDIRRRRQENLRKSDDKFINLQDAIQKHLKVRLLGYKSSSSGTIQNRVVEAFRIDNNEYVHCYLPEQDEVKLFRISRAERIAKTDEPWEHEDRHKVLSLDPFNMASEKEEDKIEVKLRLKLPAKNALEEQYPSVSQYITQIDNKDTWLLETYAYSLTPLIAFYLSYMPFIEIVKVDGLKEALLDYIGRYLPWSIVVNR